jgi:xanthine dehydrogenase accessory factor
VNQLLDTLYNALRRGDAVVLSTVIEVDETAPMSEASAEPDPTARPVRGARLLVSADDPTLGTTGDPTLDERATRDARTLLEAGNSEIRTYRAGRDRADTAVFHHVFVSPARMIIIGATDVAASLAWAAHHLDYRVTVCDARTVFATAGRFLDADEVVADWPDRYFSSLAKPLGPRDVICVLSHDRKFDLLALAAAVSTSAGYIGAMGSRRTQAERRARLRAEGITDEQLARIMGPIGIDIGARSPKETAIAIIAEIIARHAGRPVPSLRDGRGPIHGPS